MSDVPNEFKETAAGIAEVLDVPVRTVYAWIERAAGNDFPDTVVGTIGRYKFYDIREVKSWYELYSKATKGMRRNA
jgi:hypothetical protein